MQAVLKNLFLMCPVSVLPVSLILKKASMVLGCSIWSGSEMAKPSQFDSAKHDAGHVADEIVTSISLQL